MKRENLFKNNHTRVFVIEMEPFEDGVYHYHTMVTEYVVGLEKRLSLYRDGDSTALEMKPGVLVKIKPGVKHQIKNGSVEAGKYLLVQQGKYDFIGIEDGV